MRRGAVVAGLIGLSLLVSCGPGATHAAVILHIPLRVVADPPVSRWHCISKGACQVSYGLRVTNLSGSAVNVEQCQLIAIGANGEELFSMGLTIGNPAGTYVPGGATRLGQGLLSLTVKPSVLPSVASSTVTCQAWDWQGHAPM